MLFFLLVAAILSGALGVLAALIVGLSAPMVALSYIACGSIGMLTAALCMAARVAGPETAPEPVEEPS